MRGLPFRHARRQSAFTLIELLIAVAIAGVVLLIAVPSFRDFILVQRLKGVNAQLVTDLQYARSEAAARGTYVRLFFRQDSSQTCYSMYALKPGAPLTTRCDCLLDAPCGAATTANEVRTVRAPNRDGVAVEVRAGYLDPSDGSLDPAFAFDHRTGGLVSSPEDFLPTPLQAVVIESSISGGRLLRTTVSLAGRPTVCAVGANLGADAC